MNFQPSSDMAGFRDQVKRFLVAHLPEDIARRGKRHYSSSREDTLRWQQILNEHGWGAPHWPEEYGGTGWNPAQRMAFDIECAAAGAPVQNVQGMALVAPVLQAFGTPAQKERFLPAMLRGEAIWCQGFSEPQSGSDLASLRTSAVRRGDEYVINGQKIWTSLAQFSDWAFLLARTDATVRKQQGISFFVAKMDTPGIRVRPIISIDGQHHLNETFYDDVVVPADNLVGIEGQGWDIGKFLLGKERAFGAADLPSLHRVTHRVKFLASQERQGERRLIEDEAFARRLATLEMEVLALEMQVMEVISGTIQGERLALVGSALKVRATEVHMRLVDLALEAIDVEGIAWLPDPEREGSPPLSGRVPAYVPGVAAEYFYSRAYSIYGGTNEIQRGIIAKMVLGA